MPAIDPRLEAERIQALHGLRLRTGAAPPVLWDLCREAQARFGTAMALLTLVDHDRQVIKARVGTGLEGTPRSDAFCDQLIRSDAVLVVPDARRDARFVANPLVTGEPFVRFYAGAPLILRRGIRLGGLCLLDTVARDFSPEERATLAEMADEAMIRILEAQLGPASGTA